MKNPITRIRRSLVMPLIMLAIAFLSVPVALYLIFNRADREGQDLLLRSVQAQGRLVATALEPLLRRSDPSAFTNATDTLAPYIDNSNTHIRLLFRPVGQEGAAGFYLVGAAPPIGAADFQPESRELIRLGVLDTVTQSCSGDQPQARNFHDPAGLDEVLASIVPVLTEKGCWAIIFSYPSNDVVGAALTTPYWQRIEVQDAAILYIGLAGITLFVFLAIRGSVRRFGRTARALRLGSAESRSFSDQNEIAELDGVVAEFDRLVSTLGHSAESIRRRAEDNAHAFKTPIAIMRQSLEPLRKGLADGNLRAKRALEVTEQAVERLDNLVDDARRLDESVAELLDPPRRPVDLSRLLNQMTKAYRALAEGRGVVLAADLPEGLTVLGSEELIETAVEAVLDNAISFTPKGGRVELRLVKSGTRAEIDVVDDGPGVPIEHKDRIFERGFSLRSASRSDGETHGGIGLWTARRYLQALGGGIHAENLAGRGLMMRLDLPLVGTA